MHSGKIVFAQVMECLPWYQFHKSVLRYRGDYRVRRFTCLSQFHVMAFAQLTGRESLRDIVTCLQAHRSKLYHMGIRGPVRRSTLADANETRDWRIFADVAHVLIGIAKELYADEPLGLHVTQPVYALDSTTIDLCLSLFPWATFRTTKSAVKLHTLLDLRGAIPDSIWVTEASVHDVNMLDRLPPHPHAIYVVDRAYLDFARLYALHQSRALFIVRARRHLAFRRRRSRAVDKSLGLRSDQTIVLTGFRSSRRYPASFRRITCYDLDTRQRVVLLTNAFDLSAATIAALYRKRWSIEIFFKWVKQHLRIKAFYGTSPNAVKTQLWIAIATYVLVAILKKRLKLSVSLYTILQFLSLSVFDQVPITQALADYDYTSYDQSSDNQLWLFDL
jgi:hypothetical protein